MFIIKIIQLCNAMRVEGNDDAEGLYEMFKEGIKEAISG